MNYFNSATFLLHETISILNVVTCKLFDCDVTFADDMMTKRLPHINNHHRPYKYQELRRKFKATSEHASSRGDEEYRSMLRSREKTNMATARSHTHLQHRADRAHPRRCHGRIGQHFRGRTMARHLTILQRNNRGRQPRNLGRGVRDIENWN